MAFVPNSGVRPDGPTTRKGLHRIALGGEAIEIGQFGEVIDVQVRYENVVDLGNRHLHAHDVSLATRAEIEEQAATIAAFDRDARTGLVPGIIDWRNMV